MNRRRSLRELASRAVRSRYLPAIVAVVLLGAIAWQVTPRRTHEVASIDGRHRWTESSAPPRRSVVWQPAETLMVDLTLGEPTAVPETTSLDTGRASLIRPQLADGGSTLYFTLRTADGATDIFRSRLIDGLWQRAQKVDVLNSPADDIGPVISGDGQELILYSNRPGGQGGFDLYLSQRTPDGWSKPHNLGPRVNSPAHEYDGALSPDGQRLYFSSNRTPQMQRRIAQLEQAGGEDATASSWSVTLRAQPGLAQFDLYTASRADDGRWHAPQPLDTVNRADANEGAPVVDRTGTFLYFASDRKNSNGDPTNYDLYRVRLATDDVRSRGTAPEVENLGPGVNTAANETEPALSPEGFRLVFSSDREAADRGDAEAAYALYSSTAVEIDERVAWDDSRWQALLGWVLANWWWIVLAALLLALLAALMWYLRSGSFRRAPVPGFLLLALLLHLLVGSGTFFVYFSDEIGEAVAQKFDELRDIVLAPDAPDELSQREPAETPQFEQIEELKTIETVPQPDLARRETQLPQPPAPRPNPAAPQPAVLKPPELPEVVRTRPEARLAMINTPLASHRPVNPQLPPPETVAAEETRAVQRPTPQPVAPAEVDVAPADLAAPSPTPPVTPVELAQPNVRLGLPQAETIGERPAPSTANAPPSSVAELTARLDRATGPIFRSPADTTAPVPTENPAELVPSQPVGPPALAVDVNIGPPETAGGLPDRLPASARAATSSEGLPIGAPHPESAERSTSETLARGPAVSLDAPAVPLRAAAALPPGVGALQVETVAGTPPSIAPPAATDGTTKNTADTATVDVNVARAAPSVGALPLPTIDAADGPGDPARAKLVVGTLAREQAPGPATIALDTSAGQLARRKSEGLLSIGHQPVAMFAARLDENKLERLKQFGGSDATEAAVHRGLVWLERHQDPSGRWSLNRFADQCRDHPKCRGHASIECDTAATALALLPFLGAGHTHRGGDYRQTLDRGLRWLIEAQQDDGELYRGNHGNARMYSHAIATIALCEAYGMTRDPALREPAQRAVRFVVEAQNPQSGGWRYQPRQDSDLSVHGWQVMALKSALVSGLEVPSESLAKAARYLDSVEGQGDQRGRFGYQNRSATPSMTAEGLLCREYLGARRDDAAMKNGARYLLDHLPKEGQETSYYWYYGTQVMFHMQGAEWEKWNGSLRDLLVRTQIKDGSMAGTWDPRDNRENTGGRIYSTALRLLMLEVYYRHLPLYKVL